MERVVFSQGGPQNTERALEIAKRGALEKGISHVVVASTRGETGLKAVEVFGDTGVQVIVVTHNTGFKEPGVQEMPQEIREELVRKGALVYTGTMVLRNLGTAIRDLQGYSQQDLVANTLRMLGEGIKVCAEMVAMVADAGLVPPGDVIAVAGTRSGADTVAVIQAQPSNRFFKMKIRDILAKPGDW